MLKNHFHTGIFDILRLWKKTNLRGVRSNSNLQVSNIVLAYNQVILAENDIDLQKIAKNLWYIDTL